MVNSIYTQQGYVYFISIFQNHIMDDELYNMPLFTSIRFVIPDDPNENPSFS